jgi:hypothetical protein
LALVEKKADEGWLKSKDYIENLTGENYETITCNVSRRIRTKS